MIPKLIDQIEWSDLVILKESGREEGQQIEFKASFKGGNDYLALSDQQRANANDAIAREVVAFLNSSGGDVLIGAKEISNEDPRIEDFVLLPNASVVADRLGQSLAALIEPAQAHIQVRAIRPGEAEDGVLVVRASSSLRAPHRTSRSREVFVRRGRECSPMAMDEVQSMTVQRYLLRTERFEFVEKQFADMTQGKSGALVLPGHHFHIRAAMVPLSEQHLPLDENTLALANPRDPELELGKTRERLTVAFRSLRANWRPVLRGRRVTHLTERTENSKEFMFAARELRENGTFLSDFACLANLGQRNPYVGLHFAWLVGFCANVLKACSNLIELQPGLRDHILRFGIYCAPRVTIELANDDFFSDRSEWPEGILFLPDVALSSDTSLDEIFAQLQIDLASVVGQTYEPPYQFAPPE